MQKIHSRDIDLYQDDKGKRVYKISNTYTVKTEEFVKVAEGEDPFDVWLDQGGIDHSKINTHCLHEGPIIKAHYVEAFNGDTETEYLGTVIQDPEDDEYGDLIVDDEVKEVA